MLKTGTRIELLHMADDPDPVPSGSTGTVEFVSQVGSGREAWTQIGVAWDNGRTLMLSSPPDLFKVIDSSDE